MFVSHSPRFLWRNLNPRVKRFGSEAFETWWGNESGPLMNEISALIKKVPEISFAFFTIWGQSENERTQWSRPSPDTDSAAPWSWNPQPPELWKVNFSSLHTTQFMVFFCYSSPNRLWQHKQELKIVSDKICHFNELIPSWSQNITKRNIGTWQIDPLIGTDDFWKALLIPQASLCACRLSAWLLFQL